MNITKALQIIESHPKGPLALSVIITDDGMIDASIASISPAGDTMETLASHFGPGTIEGAIIEMAAAIIPMFHVTLWETREIVKSFEKLAVAKRWARGRGHTGEDDPGLTSYPPLAYVANDDGDLVYNPRFGKNIRADVGGLINAQPPNHF
jgi:hypothetical protein